MPFLGAIKGSSLPFASPGFSSTFITASSSKMMWFLFLFCLALAAEPPSDGQELKLVRGGCPLFWFSFQGRCYKYVASGMTWGEAELHCVSEGANLVSIHSLDENNFVNLGLD
uniref:C-type lectin domain-containing protein n=1 Tax=Poecilia mexicana TaxID=48701 RepID=A0A3B3X559_9TELE